MRLITTIALMLALNLVPAWAATVRLYMKDGSYHVAREYEVQKDRVRYYSSERGEWEEIPLELVDLKRTKEEASAKDEAISKEAAELAAEDKAEREAREEIARVPVDPGVYLVAGAELKPIKQAETKVNNNKRRSVFKAISPIPIITGKATLEVDGERAEIGVTERRPEFYFRLAAEERFGLVKVTPQKGVRIVERWTIIPVTKELVQENEMVEVFRRQVAEGLYKVWPTKPLEPGEYALIEYTDGKGNTQVWDFAVRAK
jgi:hypothetical protein